MYRGTGNFGEFSHFGFDSRRLHQTTKDIVPLRVVLCQSESEVFSVLRIKIPIGNTKIEVEAENETDLEMALRVAIRTLDGGKSPPSNPTNENYKSEPKDDNKDELTPNGSAPIPTYPIKLSYRGSQSNADRLYIALEDLGKRNGYRGVNASEILRHLIATGGTFSSKAKRPSGTAAQAMRNDERFESTDNGYVLRKWLEKDEPRIAEQEILSAESNEEPTQAAYASKTQENPS